MKRTIWRQIGGDSSPGSYGGIIARFDGFALEVLEIQPTLEFIGESEALTQGNEINNETI